jgi:hypothetical protein
VLIVNIVNEITSVIAQKFQKFVAVGDGSLLKFCRESAEICIVETFKTIFRHF